ncbi:Hint domain-containing protein, partial [Aphanothece microscopica]|uniref:Hint domain-containing protein n=1 Tax=Aphanothece microscopica TaxID=1049561 RepID=UPI00398506F1
ATPVCQRRCGPWCRCNAGFAPSGCSTGATSVSLPAWPGNDALFGGSGADTLQGGADDDSLSGGAGNDLFDFDRGSGADTVTDFDMTREDGRTADQLDVSDLRNASGDAITWRDVVVTDTNGDGTGDAVLVFPEGERVVLQGVRPDEVDSKQEMAAIGIPCFVRGTPILTPGGWRPVEALLPGDLVQTTRGLRPVIWSGARRITPAELAARPGLMPIRFATGAICNTRPLRLSPQHAVAMTGPDGQTVLVRARHLAEAGLAGVRVAGGHRAVSYHHVLLDCHAVVFAAGAAVESLYPGRQALASLAMPARLRIAAAIRRVRGVVAGFPALADLALVYGDRVHPLIGRRAALAMCARRGRAGAGTVPTLPDRCG